MVLFSRKKKINVLAVITHTQTKQVSGGPGAMYYRLYQDHTNLTFHSALFISLLDILHHIQKWWYEHISLGRRYISLLLHLGPNFSNFMHMKDKLVHVLTSFWKP